MLPINLFHQEKGMATLLDSISTALYRGAARALETEDAHYARKSLQREFHHKAKDYRTACITSLALGTITSLGLVLISPMASLGVVLLSATLAYGANSFALYFDRLQHIFEEP